MNHIDALADIFENKIEEIISRWITCVKRNVPGAKDKPEYIIKDHLPDFLRSIASAIRTHYPDKKTAAVVSSEHGQQRSWIGNYSLGQIIYEYHLLRTIIFDYLDDRATIKKEERNIINEMIDIAIREASVEFEKRLSQKSKLISRQNAILSSASDSLFMFNEELQITYANKALLDLWGLTLEEALYKTAPELNYSPEVITKLETDAKEAFRGKIVRSEVSYSSVKGNEACYQYVLSPIFDDAGKVYAVAGVSRDITEQKQLELQLESARNELYEFFMQAPAPLVILTGDDFYFRIANPPYEELIGKKAQGKTVLDVFSEEEIKYFLPILKDVYRTGKSHVGSEAPLTIKRSDGSVITKYINFGYHPFVENDGTIKGVLAVAQDVTEQVLARKEVENNLITIKEKNEEILDVLNSTSDGFVSLDKNFKVTQVNLSHVKISQISEEEQLGKNIFDLFPGTKNTSSEYWKCYNEAMKERKAIAFVDYYEALNVWTAVNVYPKNDGGLAIFYRNVTEEKRILALADADRHKFEAIFVESPASMALLQGENFVFEKINPKYQDLFRGRDILHKSLIEALPELKGGPLPQIMKDVFETGTPFIGRELLVPLIRQKGGALIDTYFDFTYSRVSDGYGKPYGVYIHAVEVTDKVNARNLLRESEVRLREAVLARDEFLSIASHELKTPLTSLKLQIQSALRKVSKFDAQEYTKENLKTLFSKNTTQINRLIRLVDDMLDLSRIQLGKLSYNFQKVDLCDLLNEVHGRLKESFEMKGTGLYLTCHRSLIGTFDRERIEQVVINLLTNALKYGNGLPVYISLEQQENVAKISVRDQGHGIKEENFERIFQRFERLVSASEVSGLGIGLYISRQIVEAHQGKIYVRNNKEGGTTFIVELPLVGNLPL